MSFLNQALKIFQVLKERLPFPQDVENYENSELCFQLALLHSVSFFVVTSFFSVNRSTDFVAISSNMDEVFVIIPSANVEALTRIVRTS